MFCFVQSRPSGIVKGQSTTNRPWTQKLFPCSGLQSVHGKFTHNADLLVFLLHVVEQILFQICSTMDDPYSSVMRYDVGYRELVPGMWYPTKLAPGGKYTLSERSIAEATRVEMLKNDVLLLTYPKSGERSVHCRVHCACVPGQSRSAPDNREVSMHPTRVPLWSHFTSGPNEYATWGVHLCGSFTAHFPNQNVFLQ